MAKINWILGSASPRRKELLTELGIPFAVRITDVEEVFPDDIPVEDVASYLAELKANAGKERLQENEVLICADTVVIVEGKLLGKPKNTAEAEYMLGLLSGKKHEVITGVCLISRTKKMIRSSKTIVYFKTLTQKEIDFYISQFKPFDKAGSYGIQEWIGYMGIERIEGTYANVMGLPTHLVYEMTQKF